MNGDAEGKRILCIGDSNTWGYDPRSWFGSQYPADVRWTGLLEQAGWKVINCGQNGLSILSEPGYPVLRGLIQSKLPADVITVMLGSNDLLGGASAEETSARMEGFLNCIRESAPDALVILIAPPVMKPGEWVQSRKLIEESSRLAGFYERLAEKLGTAFADAGTWGVELAYDGVHFSGEGHRAFADGLIKKLEEAEERKYRERDKNENTCTGE